MDQVYKVLVQSAIGFHVDAQGNACGFATEQGEAT
jgi:hypothetical protein